MQDIRVLGRGVDNLRNLHDSLVMADREGNNDSVLLYSKRFLPFLCHISGRSK